MSRRHQAQGLDLDYAEEIAYLEKVAAEEFEKGLQAAERQLAVLRLENAYLATRVRQLEDELARSSSRDSEIGAELAIGAHGVDAIRRA